MNEQVPESYRETVRKVASAREKRLAEVLAENERLRAENEDLRARLSLGGQFGDSPLVKELSDAVRASSRD